ncbi:MAG: hypothetical protein JST36_10655 [Bacteroidetes bacterium]|nr:hypothetical protein [Bacteroidota bacterium]
MEKEQALKIFTELASTINEASISKMFGCTCIKAPNGKAAAFIKEDKLVVKPPKDRIEILLKSGYAMFSPMGKERPMNGWIEIPFEEAESWPSYLEEAFNFVEAL